MQVKLLYFAQLKESAQADEETITAEHPVTVGELVRKILAQPKFEKLKGLPCRYAMNDEFVEPEHHVGDRAVIAILPPVAGG